MNQRTIIDTSQPWIMRVSQPGKDVETGGAPYLFDGALETLQVHQSGVITGVYQFQDLNTREVHRCILPAGSPWTAKPSITVNFPALPYTPHIEWAITSDAFGGAINYPSSVSNHITGDYNYDILDLPTVMIPTPSSFQIISTTAGSIDSYALGHGGTARQGDLYYTVFKRPTT